MAGSELLFDLQVQVVQGLLYFRFGTVCPQRRGQSASLLGLFCIPVDSLPSGA